MIILKANRFQGFTIGVRIADSYALQANVSHQTDVAGLHAIKGLANVMALQREVKACGINNEVYTGE